MQGIVEATIARRRSCRDMDTSASALRLWRETVPLQGTPGVPYLERRGVPYQGDALRWHPRCPFGKDRVGCLVGLVRSIRTNEPQENHRTALSLTGEKLNGLGSNGRLSLGPTRGGAIKLSENSAVTTTVAIGEGIKSTLAASGTSPSSSKCPYGQWYSAGGIPGLSRARRKSNSI